MTAKINLDLVPPYNIHRNQYNTSHRRIDDGRPATGNLFDHDDAPRRRQNHGHHGHNLMVAMVPPSQIAYIYAW